MREAPLEPRRHPPHRRSGEAHPCSDCAAACTSCADADLGERGLPELIRCVRLCLDCADICDATGRIVTRQTASDVDVVRAVVEACP
ncbi:MAG TPA: hypothetical protein VFY45_05690, partial [Baekduia sp.]|nr:hypothetical protein [Baekduia sp.]